MRGVGVPVEAAEFDHRTDQRINLRRASAFDVLEHRGLVPADLLGPGDALLQRGAKADAELVGHFLRLAHHSDREFARQRELADVGQRRVRQAADRVEAQVAPKLEPDLGADVFEHRGLEARGR